MYINQLFAIGRCDAQIKVRGHRVNLQEIENVIKSATGVKVVASLAVVTKYGKRYPLYSISLVKTLCLLCPAIGDFHRFQ